MKNLLSLKIIPLLVMALISSMWTSDEINIFQMLLSHRNTNTTFNR